LTWLVALMLGCGAAVLLGLLAVARWGGLTIEPPGPDVAAGKRYVWSVAVTVVAGIGSGLLVAGAGGRLAMRLLAATAGDAAQGRITEAEETVGEITTGGTIGFVLFIGLFAGLTAAAGYMVLRRWLPGGRWGGVTFGALLLVVLATRVEPLRGDNPDFDLVGPGWLALVVFGALAVLHGMTVAALAARYAQRQPVLSREPRVLLRYAPVLLIAPAGPISLGVVLAGLATAAVSTSGLPAFLRTRRAITAGRAVLALLALVSLPGFLSTAADIAGRGP
jgi:hypothetical protein